MELILWRHAEAEDGMPDLARPLTQKGVKQAQRMAAWLERQLPERCRILVSPAARAQETARALGRRFRTVEDIAPGATAAAVLAACDWPAARETTLVVGHQPTLGEVAALLVAGDEQPWSIRKGALWWLSSRQRGEAGAVLVRVVMAPDFL